ncbi:MAG: thiolase family protein [Candidatus Thalassarchaeaceae archaeon]|nr:thiolase family protein [Candidatus Thalassarchaeaceae archaeon]
MRAVIASYARSPFQRAHRGLFVDSRPEDLAAEVVKSLVKNTPLLTSDYEDLMMGCAYPEGEQGLNIGRITTYLSDLPFTIPGVTTNRLCGSSMQVIHTAAGSISMGSGNAFICAGVESMSRIQRGGFNRSLHPTLETEYPAAYIGMGQTAENLAKRHNISRSEQELFAASSHEKAINAQNMGYFSTELVQVGDVNKDGCMRPPDLAKMAQLKPAFSEIGTVTAATSSPLTDGAAGVIVCSEEIAENRGIKPLASIISTAVAGVEPEFMGYGPVPASLKALSRADLTMDDIDVIEMNEAFSAQSIACISDLNLDTDDNRINIDGGALAIGHPLGASGSRITGKAASLLQRTGGEYALATMCIGGGMGIATILQRE